MATRKNTVILKRSSVPGKIPSAGDLLLGELALNTADVIAYASGTTSNSILPIGWDRIARTGDTVTGNFYINGFVSATTISATTYYGDGANLTNVAHSATSVFSSATAGQTFVSPTTAASTMSFSGVNIDILTDNTNKILTFSGATAAGEVNTASNVGGANGIYYQKSTYDLQFRSLSAGTNITITSGATVLTINSTATGGGAQITGGTYTKSTGNLVLTDSTAGTVTVTGITDVYITGGTLTQSTKSLALTDNTGGTITVTGFSTRTTGTTTTTNATLTTAATISTLASGSSILEAYVTAKGSSNITFGHWKRTLGVIYSGGTITLGLTNADIDYQTSLINPNSVSFNSVGTNLYLAVSGSADNTITWNTAYEIII